MMLVNGDENMRHENDWLRWRW